MVAALEDAVLTMDVMKVVKVTVEKFALVQLQFLIDLAESARRRVWKGEA